MRSGKSRAGSGIWLLFLVGLLIFLLSRVFRGKRSSSQYDQLIIKRLQSKANLSPQTAQMWAAVARHETADYSSSLAVNANNLFGMGYGSGKGTDYKVAGGAMDYAGYTTPEHSVDDLVLYLEDNRYPKTFDTLADLVRFMKGKGYFTDTFDNYVHGAAAARDRAGFTFPVGFTGAGASGGW